MQEADPTTAHSEARHILDTFGSVGADRFDLTLTTAAGDKVSFHRGVPLAELARLLPDRIDTAAPMPAERHRPPATAPA